MVAVALALPKLITDPRLTLVTKVIGVIFRAVTTILFTVAFINYTDTGIRLREAGIITTPMWLYKLMVAGILLCILLSFVLLF